MGRRVNRLERLEGAARRTGGTVIFVSEPENPEVYHSEGRAFTRAQVEAFERENPRVSVTIITFRDEGTPAC